MATRIEDYALIGDCETAALVSRQGSIDWLCWPRFDSCACFAALLGTEENGFWRIAPSEERVRTRRRYRGNTLIVETDFATENGEARLIDFMPLRGQTSDIVRIVKGLRGSVAFRCEVVLRFDYGSAVPWVTRLDNGVLRAISGPDMVLLRTPVRLRGEGLRTVGEFTVGAGESVPFVLAYAPSHLPAPDMRDAEDALSATEQFWSTWVKGCSEAGRYGDAVIRSLLMLKALTHAPTGGIVAAPTTSLPEQIGGVRNWDYRYCWLRDATLTLLSFMNAGLYAEARAWRDWLMRASAGSPSQIRIMYGVAGERRLPEIEAAWLPGYENSKPVRIGNAAAEQLQLDVFGEVMDALHQARLGGVQGSEEGWTFQRALLDHLESVWRSPDEGIWEVRGPRRHFTYSKVMAWVAFDRAIKTAETFKLDGPLDKWRALRAEIHDQVCAKAFDRTRGAFMQAYGSQQLDASVLLLPAVGFIACDDPRMTSTIAAIERTLLRDGFVLRYDSAETDDGLPPGEGVFLACSFWLADAYILSGRIKEAERLFDRLLALRNDVGLLAEEYDPAARRLVGNFPQAFSHLALIDTAHNLARAEKPVEQRGGRRTARLAAQ